MEFKHYTGYNAELKDRSRQLRKNMTRQERHLWYDFLRDYPVKVYRQRSVDWFIADFYCSRAHLVIELDGGAALHVRGAGIRHGTERSFTELQSDGHSREQCRRRSKLFRCLCIH